jgi:DNA-binding CsgD family transcriptional regulator
VHLAEELYVRLFVMVLWLTVAGCGISLWFGGIEAGRAPGVLTALIAVIGMVLAVTGLTRRREVYRWLRYDRAHQLAPGLLAALAVAFNGPDSPSWWVALPLLWLVADVSSTTLAAAAAVVTAGAYLLGTTLGGEALIHNGDAGVLAAAVALPLNVFVGRLAAEVFGRFVLSLHRLEAELAAPATSPIAVPNLATAPSDPRRHVPTPRAPRRPRTAGSRLTSRQLEAALLARDGLLQSEIALCLGISPRQVERLLQEARTRVGATTTAHLVAMLVAGKLAPPAPIA